MRRISQQRHTPVAPLAKVFKLIDIITQDICLRRRLDNRWDWVVPIMKQFEYLILSSTRLIFLSLGCVLLNKPVYSCLAHRDDAKLAALSPCPDFKSGLSNMRKAAPASLSCTSWLY